MYHQNIHNTYYLPVEKTYTRLCRREVDENVHILSRRQALIKFELRVCTERRPIALLRVLPRDFPFLPFSLSLFLRTIAFKAIRRTPLRGAKDCYERICGNPRSNLHADDNGCISSLISRFCRRLLFPQVVSRAAVHSKEMQVAANALSGRAASAPVS